MIKKANALYKYTVSSLFEEQVTKTPFTTAIRCNETNISYQALNDQANQYAHWLQKKHIEPGEFVGILLEPGIDFIVSILAIIKIGAIYLPFDSSAPSQRLEEIINDAKPRLILTNEHYLTCFKHDNTQMQLIKNLHLESVALSRQNNKYILDPATPIYMMYTSGSTGRPKGVIISHQAVVNLVKVDNYAAVKEEDSIAQFSNLAFDGSTFEIWSALLNGATLNIIPGESRQDYIKLTQFFEKNPTNILFLPTGFFHQLIKSTPDTLNTVRVVVFGGEQVNANLLKNFIHYRKEKRLPITLINGYGPTEATTFTCRHVFDEQSNLSEAQLASIGTPIHNSSVYILDENFQPTLEGELCISGVNLAVGYHNCPVQNKEKFVDNPFCTNEANQRLYRSGDKVRKLPTGELLCLGRLDDQVKIGGFRIHLNEIEYQLMHHPDISLAAVKVDLGGEYHQLLAAYMVVSSENTILNAGDIRKFLSKSLPPYMLPAKYILIKEMPLTLVGKVDKDKLDQMEHIDLAFHIDTSSTSIIEECIKKIWMHLLNRSVIDVHKNLFELGANSLLITDACVKINAALHSELQISNLLSHPTIHKLSRFLEGDVDHPRDEVKKSLHAANADIAIIGMSCRFPKANSLHEFWENICAGKECLTRFKEDDLSLTLDQNKVSHEHFVPVKGIFSDIDQFDANFFGFSPIDASVTDPQQRVFLECAWEALEHAGVAPNKATSKVISVFSGMTDSTYLTENLVKSHWFRKEHDRFQQRIVTSLGMLSTQVSYRLNLRGQSLNINTACSTGLITVAQACQDLIAGSSDIALAGAVSITVPQVDGYVYQKGSIESPDGQCRPFSQDANGTVFSDGVGVVILKRLSDAIADHDTIYAVIKGCGINNDGSDKLGYTAPSTSGQIACISKALAQSAITPHQIGYVEAHGTATALGDVIEMDALATVYGDNVEKKQFCALGSVKSNIGHTDVVAGMAGLIKTVLCLYHQKIPPTLHFEKPNPDIALEDTPFFINTKLLDWKDEEKSRYAGVSAFGVGGTNAHMILSDYRQTPVVMRETCEQLFILSAKTERALEENTQKLTDYLFSVEKETQTDFLAEIAGTLQTGREDFSWRRIGIGKTCAELISYLNQDKMKRCDEESSHNLVFMFPGQGTQYHLMAAQLMKEIPSFSLSIEQGVNLAKNHLDCDLLAIIQDPLDSRLNQTQFAQPALFIVEYALAKLLISCGLTPTALIGHSVGEYVAACLAGVFSYEDAIALICERGLLMATVSSGDMLAIECTVEEFGTYQEIIPVELALHNAINHCVASGPADVIKQLEQHLATQGTSYQKLKVSHPFHSQVMEEIEASFKALFSMITLSAPHIPIISNVTGDWLTTQEATSTDYWYNHLRNTVQMCKGFATLITDEHPLFIEVGPGRSLSTFIKQTMHQYKKHLPVVATLPNQGGHTTDLYQLLHALGSLWQEGCDINWSYLYKYQKRQHIPLPTYSFQRQRYWVEPDGISQSIQHGTPGLYKLAWSSQQAYINPISLSSSLLAQHSWIIFKDELGLGDQFISLLKKHHIQPIVVTFHKTYSANDHLNFKLNFAQKQHYFDFIQSIKAILKNPVVLHLSSFTHESNLLPSSEEINHQLTLGFDSLLYLMQAFIEIIGDQVALKTAVITTGVQRVLGTEKLNPVNGTLFGPCCVARQEHKELKFKLIDLNLEERPQQNVNLLSKILESCVGDVWSDEFIVVPYRNGYQWNLMYGAIKPEQRGINRLKDNGVYLLTGGLGGIALSCCEAIAKTVSTPTFILLSRSQMPLEVEWEQILQNPSHPCYEKIIHIRKLKALGATILIYQVDIAQFEPLDHVIRECMTLFGTINGLIHAAGIAHAELVQFKSREMAQKVFVPKILGTYNLIKALKGISLDFVVLKSSLAALLGGYRHVDYVGANACLDVFANSNLFSFSSFVVSINWNTWREVGIAAKAARKGEPTFLGKGNDISPRQGQALFLKAVQGNESQVAVSNIDLNGITTKQGFEESTSASPTIKTDRHHLNMVTNYLAPSNEMECTLVLVWQDMLGVEDIGVNDDFFALGGHSLKALSLIERINNLFSCKLSATQIYRSPTIKQLCSTIEQGFVKQQSNIVIPLKMAGKKPPYLFLCHPVSGLIYCFNDFSAQSDLPLSIYGLQDPSVDMNRMLYDSLLEMAEDYLSAIKNIQPDGPYYLMGYSFGGNLVYEVAHLLQQEGQKIDLLAMIDSWAINAQEQQNEFYFKKQFQTWNETDSTQIVELAWKREALLLNHSLSTMNQEMVLFKASHVLDDYKAIEHPTNGWSRYNKGTIICHKIDGTHDTIINAINSKIMLSFIKNRIL